MSNLIDTTEMYLRTIVELEEEGTPALRARIAERLQHSGPTVSQTVARMERDGLLSVQPDRSLVLSEEGRARAIRVMRKHRLAERLLMDVIGLEFEWVHDEACRWEHVMSERVERKILALLEERTRSPYGNPIPGLAELGVPATQWAPGASTALTAVPETGPCAGRDGVVVDWLGEPLQAEGDTLSLLRNAGVVPGALIDVSRSADRYVVRAHEGGDPQGVSLPPESAAQIFVRRPDETETT